MKANLLARNTLVWLALLVATACQVAIGQSAFVGEAVAYVLLVIAALKSRWVILDFMGLRRAGRFWRAIMGAWLGLTVLVIAIAFHMARS